MSWSNKVFSMAGYMSSPRPGNHCWYCFVNMGYCDGIAARAMLNGIGRTITLPFTVPVVWSGYVWAIGFGWDLVWQDDNPGIVIAFTTASKANRRKVWQIPMIVIFFPNCGQVWDLFRKDSSRVRERCQGSCSRIAAEMMMMMMMLLLTSRTLLHSADLRSMNILAWTKQTSWTIWFPLRDMYTLSHAAADSIYSFSDERLVWAWPALFR